MSCTICYRSTSSHSPHFRGGTSDNLKKLQEVFGSIISLSFVDALHAMAIASDDKFYDEVAEVVERVGEIEFWGEY